MTPFVLSEKDNEELKQGFERTDAMKPKIHSGCGWASMPQQQEKWIT